MTSVVSGIYRQLKGKLNYLVGCLINRVDERLRVLEGMPPTFWCNAYRRALSQVATVGWLIQHSPRVDAWRWQDCNWSVVYAGSSHHMAELQHLLCPQTQPPTLLGRVNIWDLPGKANQWANKADLVVCELNRRQPQRSAAAYSFTMAPWVRMVLDVDRSPESIVAGMRPDVRSNWRKTMEKGFVCRYSHDLADFDLFYHSMFLPFISRFGERAIIAPYDNMLAEFRQGGLIIVERDGQPVGGTMCLQTDSTFYTNWLGIQDGDYGLIRDGAQVAMIWFGINLARQSGCRYYDFGRVLASMQNGMLRFKRAWGAQIRSDHRLHGTWTFFSTNLPVDLRQHLNEQQFLTEIDGKHYIVFLSDSQDLQDSSLIGERLNAAQGYGLGGVLIAKCGYSEKRPVGLEPTHWSDVDECS